MKRILRNMFSIMMCIVMCCTMILYSGCGDSAIVQISNFNKEVTVDGEAWSLSSRKKITKLSVIVITYTFTIIQQSDTNGGIEFTFNMTNSIYSATSYEVENSGTVSKIRTTGENGVPGTKITSTIDTTGKNEAKDIKVVINVGTNGVGEINAEFNISANKNTTISGNGASNTFNFKIEKLTLDVPSNVSYDESTYILSWNRVANATTYIVYIDDKDSENDILVKVDDPKASVKLSDYLTKTSGHHDYWVQAFNTDTSSYDISDFSSECHAYIGGGN